MEWEGVLPLPPLGVAAPDQGLVVNEVVQLDDCTLWINNVIVVDANEIVW